MISENQINYIIALEEYKRFQVAADKCFVTQPTLSMQIKKVEEILGNRIFDRTTTPLSLTNFGKKVMPKLKVIQNEYASLSRLIKETDGNFKENIRVGIIPTIAHYLIPEYYGTWQKRIRNAQLDILELKTKDVLKKLSLREIDLGIIAGPIQEKDFQNSILYNEKIKVFTADVSNSIITIDKLEEMRPWLLAEGNCLRTQMVNFCNIKEPDDKWVYSGGSLEVLIKMVVKNGGYTLLPEFFELPKSYHKHLKEIDNHNPFRQIIAIYNKNDSKKSVMDELIREIQSSKSNSFSEGKLGELLPWE